MKYFYYLILFLFSCEQNTFIDTKVSDKTAAKEIKESLINSDAQLNKPYVILVSLDGFRYDYAKRYKAKTLLSFDVQAEKMISSFPTKTFPNHYAIATGLYPGHNGLVSNEFYDRTLDLVYKISNRSAVENPRFYKGTPVWVLATEQNMVNASMFWVGSEAPIKGKHPTYYYKYDGSISHTDRVNQTITWLQMPKAIRPHFITLYFSITDDIGHKYGPNSTQIAQAVKNIDEVINDLKTKVEKLNLPVNIIIVSDHGMIEVDRNQIVYLKDMVPSDMTMTTNFPAMVYSNDENRVDSLYQVLAKDTLKYSVYLKRNIPSRYHYNKVNSERIGDLIIMPKPPYTFGKMNSPIAKGTSTHGYDPLYSPEMGAIFYADGPAFKKTKIAAFENVHVYPLIAKILGLNYEEDSIDGSIEVLQPILK